MDEFGNFHTLGTSKVQSIRIFNERKSRKVDNKGKSDLIAELVEIRVTSGASEKVEVSLFASKS
jgi:hypothetical protein